MVPWRVDHQPSAGGAFGHYPGIEAQGTFPPAGRGWRGGSEGPPAGAREKTCGCKNPASTGGKLRSCVERDVKVFV